MNVSLAESVLSRYAIPRAMRLLHRFRDDARVRNQLSVLSLAEPALAAEGLSLQLIPRPVLITFLKIIGTIPVAHFRQIWADHLVRSARSYATVVGGDDIGGGDGDEVFLSFQRPPDPMRRNSRHLMKDPEHT